MSRLAAQNNPYIKTIYAQGMRLVLAITIPGAVGLIILAHPIISTLFQWGVFVKSDVLAAIPILSIYSLSIPLYSWATLSTRAFHALKDTKTPMRLAGVSLLINTSLSFILMHYWGVKGLAWASLIAISVQSIYLHVSLMRKSALFHHLGVLKAFLKIMAAAISMGGVVWMIYSIFFQQDMDNKYYQIISLCLLIPFAVIFYGFLLVILGFEDLKALKALCYRVLDSKKATNPTAIE
jgi:putative peptidoglycan lipid II flippase